MAERIRTPEIAGLFFALASAIAFAAGASLAFPGHFFDVMWQIKATEHALLLRAGLTAVVGFVLLSATMGIASFGAFTRRRWGWWLTFAIFAVHALSDASRIVLGAPWEGLIGVTISVLILAWLTRPHVRALFDR
jgi:uncharacterized membrane protein (DUF2068 family)